MRTRASLAARGAAAILVVLAGTGAAISGGAGTFSSDAAVTTTLPGSAGPVREDSPVQFRGVRVGTLSSVTPQTSGARLTLHLDDNLLGDIPADVQVRVLPRTVFGDQYVDLVAPEGRSGSGRLEAGAVLPPDTSRPTAQLYQAYTRMYELLNSLQPAKLQVALTALADSLRGRGGQLGTMIDEAADLAQQSRPMLDNLGPDLRTMSALADDLEASAPDLLRSLDNAVALSGTVVDKRQNIDGLLTGGIALTDQSNRLLAENSQRVVQLVRSADPVSDVLGGNPQAFSTGMRGMDRFLDGANRAFSTGFFKIRAKVTFENPRPYGPADCPRYPGMTGPNCGAREAGPIGPVGSPQEMDAMRQLAPLLPPTGSPAPPSPDVMGLLLGPMVRGSEVVTP